MACEPNHIDSPRESPKPNQSTGVGISHVFGEEAFAKELTKVAGEFLSLADASPSQYQAKNFGVLSDDLQKLNASLKGIASFMDAIAGPQP
jgi:hypothetical protein